MKEKIALISVLANIFLASGKILAGIFSGSVAILAEGLHSFMDIFSSAISYVGIKVSQKPESKKSPYGYHKVEVLAGAIITIILLVTGIGIILEGYNSFLNPEKIQINYWILGIMLFSVIVNEVLARLKIHFGKKENSIALLSDGIHSRVDVYASLAIFVGLLISPYWIFIDSILAILVGLYIIKESFSLGKEAIDSLLDTSAGEKIEKEIEDIVKFEKVEMGSLKTERKGAVIAANLEIKLSKDLTVEEATKISDKLRKELMRKISNLRYVAIQIVSHEAETMFYKPSLGRAFGWQRKGRFKDKIEAAEGEGPGGYCVCPKCGYQALHQKGIPCPTIKCPKCKISLIRK